MASLRDNATILALASSLLVSLPLEVQAAPELAATRKEAPNAQRPEYVRGEQAAHRGDAEGALDAWAGVLTATPESIKNRRFRMNLVVDAIYVALDAHARQPNLALLERTLDLYYGYFSAYEAQYGNPNIPRPVINARFDLKAAIETSDRPGAAPPAEPAATTEPPPEPPPPQVDDNHAAASGVRSTDAGPATKGDGTGLLIAGGVTMAAGAGLTSLIAVGAINGKKTRNDLDDPAFSEDQRSRIDAEGKKANTMLIAGLVSAPVVLITGAVLVGIGAKRRVDSRRSYASVAPSLRPTFAGVQLGGRF